MLKKKSKILLIVLSIILLFSSVCLATEASVDNTIVTTSEENSAVETTSENGDNDNHTSTEATANWVNSDLYLSDDEVVIDNVVDGNVFIAANEVKITGEKDNEQQHQGI